MSLPSEILKAETQSLHRLVDAQPLFRRLIAPDLTLVEYGAVLELLHIWMRHMTPHLKSLTLSEEQQPQRKLDALHSDMVLLGIETRQDLIKPIEVNLNFALGVHYVVEGSSLGARFLAPRIETALNREDATLFYRLYADQTQRLWAQTQEQLNSQLQSPEALDVALEGARYAFNRMLELNQGSNQSHATSGGLYVG